jgi:hypothetical protein
MTEKESPRERFQADMELVRHERVSAEERRAQADLEEAARRRRLRG